MVKKILIITSEFPPEPGGIGNHAYNLSKYLSLKKYEVSVLADRRNRISTSFDNQQLFQIYRIDLKKLRVFMYINRLINGFKLIKKHDIIITSGKFSLWLGALGSLFFKKKFIAVIHGTEVNFNNYFLNKSIAISLKRYNSVIAVSEYTKSLVFKLKLKRCNVIFNGFEAYEKPIKIKENDTYPNIITVGSVTERKGQKNVIESLPQLIKEFPTIHYHVIGMPNEKKKYVALAKKLKVNNHITFYGKVNNDEKYSLLAQNDIFVMLSNHTKVGDVEGFGIAILEANSLGVPAIGSEKCGIEDAIDNNNSGIIINPKDHLAFKKSILTILKNSSKFSKNAKKWSSNFTWNKVINEYINEIEF